MFWRWVWHYPAKIASVPLLFSGYIMVALSLEPTLAYGRSSSYILAAGSVLVGAGYACWCTMSRKEAKKTPPQKKDRIGWHYTVYANGRLGDAEHIEHTVTFLRSLFLKRSSLSLTLQQYSRHADLPEPRKKEAFISHIPQTTQWDLEQRYLWYCHWPSLPQ